MKPKVLFFVLLLTISIRGIIAQNPRTHVVERTTATACGSCPCFDSIISDCILPGTPHSIAIFYHTWISAFYNKDLQPVLDSIQADHSDLRTDRDGKFYQSFDLTHLDTICDSAKNHMNADTTGDVRIVIESKGYDWAGRTLTVNANFYPDKTSLTGTFMVNAIITEDRLVALQSHEPQCGTEGKYPVPHNDVARMMAYYPYGDSLTNGTWPQTQTLTRNFSITLDTAWVPVNCNLIVFVYKQGPQFMQSKFQQVVKQSVTWPLGIAEGSAIPDGKIVLIPNPAENRVNAHMSIPETGLADITLLDMAGKLVKRINRVYVDRNIYNAQFDVSDLSPGQYIFSVQVNNCTYSGKLLISH